MGRVFDIAPHPYPLPRRKNGEREIVRRCGQLSSPRPYGESDAGRQVRGG